MGARKKGNADYEKGYRKGYQNGFATGSRKPKRTPPKPKIRDFSNLEEVVRCKECIYNSDNTDGDTRGWCYKHGIDIIGFCSEGER